MEENIIKNPKITVVTPTYNRADLIVETIESILSQDFEDFEYFILDDGSTDSTEKVVKPFLADRRVKYLKHVNAGEAETVNWGWGLASGEYFTQVNSDDPILPGLFSEMVRVLDAKRDVVVAYPDFYFINEKGDITKKDKTPDWNFLDALSHYSCYAASAGTFIRKTAFSDWKKIKDSHFKHISDVEMYWNMALRGNFFHVPKFLATWRVHDGSISSSRYESIQEVEEWLQNYFSRKNLPPKVRQCLRAVRVATYRYYIHLLEECDIDSINKSCQLKYYQRKLELELARDKNIKKRVIKDDNMKNDTFHPLVSIVIPVYNGSNYLREAIDSALAQTYDNIEIIVVNDGSIDDTEQIVKSYGDKIRYFVKENGGVASALNLGIREMHGEYFSWLSHDDIYWLEKVEAQVEFLRNNPARVDRGIVFSRCEILDEYRKEFFFEQFPNFDFNGELGGLSFVRFLFLSGLNGCSLLIPKRAFYEVAYFDESLKTTQDYDLWFKLVDAGYKFSFINLPLMISRRHSRQDTRSVPDVASLEREALFLKAFNIFKSDLAMLLPDAYREIIVAMKINSLGRVVTVMEEHIKNSFKFRNVQIGDNDLIGNKFNGHDLHRYLRKKGIDSSHLVWNKESNDENTYIIAGEKSDRLFTRDTINAVRKNFHLDGFLNPTMLDILYNRLFLDADVVHLHLMHNGLIDLHLLPLLSKLKPLVWTLHDPWAFSGHCIQHFDCTKWESSCADCPYLSLPFDLEKDNSTLNFVLKKQAIQDSSIEVVVASRFMFEKASRSPIFKNKNIHLVPFGIDQNIFAKRDKAEVRRKMRLSEEAIIISFRGDNNYKKGLDYVNYVIQNITSTRPIIFLVFGGGTFRKNPQFDYIEYGWIKDDFLMTDIYNASDLFLMPSAVESFGMMAIEAMSCGTLPIVLDGTALPETVNAPECGVSTKREKSEYLKAVQYYIDHDNARKERAEKCLEFARKNYNKDVYVEKIVNVYDRVVSTHVLTDEYRVLLEQLKKHMAVESTLVPKAEDPTQQEEIPKNEVQASENVWNVRRPSLMSLKHVIRPFMRNIAWYVSPTFRMLVGNRERMKMLLEKNDNQIREVANLENLITRQNDNQIREVANLENLITRHNDNQIRGVANLENLITRHNDVLLEKAIRKALAAQPYMCNENILGERVFIVDDHVSETRDYTCNGAEFFEEMKKYILKTDVVLDIGCGIRPQNFFVPKVHMCIEPFEQYRKVVKPFLPNDTHFIFLKGDALSAMRSLDDQSVDTVFMMDLIEHLEKEDGLELLKEADRVARKQIVVFTPLGFYPMHFREEGQKDAWGLDGNDVQEHRSGWLPEDFGKSWDFHICMDCHDAFLPEEKARGEKYSALMAIKTKVFNGFPIIDGVPDFVKDEYEKRYIGDEE